MLSSNVRCIACYGHRPGRPWLASLLAQPDWTGAIQQHYFDIRLCRHCERRLEEMTDLERRARHDLRRAHNLEPGNAHIVALMRQLGIEPDAAATPRVFDAGEAEVLEPSPTRRVLDEIADAEHVLLGSGPESVVRDKLTFLVGEGSLMQLWAGPRCVGFWVVQRHKADKTTAPLVAIPRAQMPAVVKRLAHLGFAQFDAEGVSAAERGDYSEQGLFIEDKLGHAFLLAPAERPDLTLRRPDGI